MRMLWSKQHTREHRTHAANHLQRFQDAGRKVMILQAVTKHIIRITEDALGSRFWGDVSVPRTRSRCNSKVSRIPKSSKLRKRLNKQDLAFDTNDFRSQYEFTFPEKAVEISSLRPEERSLDDVWFIRSMMRGILSFRHYSNTMQLMLARVVHYKRFGKRRVVVRKGHQGDSFYFVFSGVIAVTQDEDGTSALLDPEPILLRKGASFGEVALLKGLRRNATVVCMEETEFLVVDRDEFFRNKLDQELQKELEYRFRFFRSLDLFSSWSDESLENLAEHCKTEECHYSRVIVNDTSETKNIIFVTKGHCDVLRLVDLSQCPSYLKWIKRQEALLGKLMRSSQPETRAGKRDTIFVKSKASAAQARDIHSSLLAFPGGRNTWRTSMASQAFSDLAAAKVSSSKPRVTHAIAHPGSAKEPGTVRFKVATKTTPEYRRRSPWVKAVPDIVMFKRPSSLAVRSAAGGRQLGDAHTFWKDQSGSSEAGAIPQAIHSLKLDFLEPFYVSTHSTRVDSGSRPATTLLTLTGSGLTAGSFPFARESGEGGDPASQLTHSGNKTAVDKTHVADEMAAAMEEEMALNVPELPSTMVATMNAMKQHLADKIHSSLEARLEKVVDHVGQLVSTDSFLTLEELVRKKWRARVKSRAPMGEALPSHLVASAYLRIDALRPGQYFRGVDIEYIESCLEKDGRLCQQESCLDVPVHRDPRAMVIVSQGSEVIRVKLDKFCELVDLPTVQKLKEETRYPSDNKLCCIFLEENRWKIFKRDLISDLKRMSGPLRSLNPRASLPQQHQGSEWDFGSQGILHLGLEGKDRKVSGRGSEHKVGSHNTEL
ncbi:uncharacterized protein LOC115083213 [Rhinatrema bivittatum]|uniref:uncharacterized protein LOC115083213 n=1 Tax=Rhinatrema bivittatum TaxID=194408 RepID=UPI00112D04A8|nr:uncharacterized protein LOC115083213 [Rhinatrema bivittatum]